jgi:hypothetical protein
MAIFGIAAINMHKILHIFLLILRQTKICSTPQCTLVTAHTQQADHFLGYICTLGQV